VTPTLSKGLRVVPLKGADGKIDGLPSSANIAGSPTKENLPEKYLEMLKIYFHTRGLFLRMNECILYICRERPLMNETN